MSHKAQRSTVATPDRQHSTKNVGNTFPIFIQEAPRLQMTFEDSPNLFFTQLGITSGMLKYGYNSDMRKF